MIKMDPPVEYNPRYGPSCHLVSDIPGPDGQAELIAFAKSLGMQERYIQYKGTEHEHFDLWRGRLAQAEKAGAVLITRREMVEIFRAKREWNLERGLPVRVAKAP